MVIGIIFVLIVTFRDVFQNTNKDFLYTESCVNKIHWDINNFIYSAITSRWLYISSWTIFPKQYIISINPTDEIHLRYKDQDNTTWTYLKNNLSSEKLRENYCSMNNYTTKLSGNNFDITINKESIENQNSPTFTIGHGEEKIIENTQVYICYTWNNCKEIANFITDIRTQTVQKKRCILINKEWIDCLKRDQ